MSYVMDHSVYYNIYNKYIYIYILICGIEKSALVDV